MKNLLFITTDFNYSSGVTRHVINLLNDTGRWNGYNLFFMSNGGDAINEIKKTNVKTVFEIHYGKGNIKYTYFIHNYIKILSVILDYKIDIVHTHHRYPELLASLIPFRKFKLISTVHSKVQKWNYLSFRSDLLISVSHAVKNHIIQKYSTTPSKVVVVYNYLSCYKNEAEKIKKNDLLKPESKSEMKKVLFVGRLCYTKGVDILIKAVNELKNRMLLDLVLVGKIEEEFESELDNLDVSITKIFEPVADISKYYLTTDIVVLPAREDPFPYVMLEAGLFMKPFIGSNVDGIAEFIDDGVNGLLFNKDDHLDLADKIEFLFANRPLAQKMSLELFNKVENVCCKKTYLEILKQFYEK